METLFIAATEASSDNSLIKLSFQPAFDWFNNCDTIKQELLVGSFGIGKKPGISIREPQIFMRAVITVYRHGKTDGSGRVNWVTGHGSKTGHFKRVENGFGSIGLRVGSGRVRLTLKKAIREEIGDAKFCIMVDEARDESMKEQMAMVFKYVDAEGFVKERFFGLIHVVDTAALTLKKGETMKITDKLCQALQSQSQDILNVMHLVSSTKAFIQKFRDDGWDGLLTIVISFCENHCIDVLDMNARYIARRGRARNQQDNVTIEHHYLVNIFYATIDSQLQELNYQFNEDAMELLRLSSALEPQEALKSFRSSDLCLLVKNFYPQDFIDYDKQVLEKELLSF
uniref:DUF4371 domain-containing protein n=1 Tax=Quercus lobata TaxID=97700 RepID=A0A7N2MLC1_QUELO